MSGGQGLPITKAGTATTTETRVTLPAPFVRGAPNANGTRPTPAARALYLHEVTISNLDATNNLLVRLNRQSDRKTLKPNTSVTIRGTMVNDLTVASSAATVAYDIVGTSS
jgi:hypothetical protein